MTMIITTLIIMKTKEGLVESKDEINKWYGMSVLVDAATKEYEGEIALARAQADKKITNFDKGKIKKVGEIKGSSKEILNFLSSSWPGSILSWSNNDVEHFASCFTPHYVGDGKVSFVYTTIVYQF